MNNFKTIRYIKKDYFGYITIDTPQSKVNILSFSVMKELDSLIDNIHTDKNIEALIITSAKKDIFIAGADITEIKDISLTADGVKKSQDGQEVLNKIEDLKIPTIAVIDGVALGGGCELALACTYRVATFNDKVKIGCPEVNLGIIPGLGGTYRLPKLVGLPEALKLILSARPIDVKKAYKIGLIDKVFPQVNLDQNVLNFVKEIKPYKTRKKFLTKKAKGLTPYLDKFKLGKNIIINQAAKNVIRKTKGFYPAPLKAINVIRKSINCSRDNALKNESAAFGELAVTDISKNLVRIFFSSQYCKKWMPDNHDNENLKDIKKCGIIGAGVMGGGIAQLLSYRNIRSRLKDLDYLSIAKGLSSAYKVYQQAAKRRKIKKSQIKIKMSKISGTTDYTGFKSVDCIIEAVVENLEIKKQVIKEVSNIVPDETLICTNTSALSVTEMASMAKDPSRVIGFHFFNPVHRMPLIEIVAAEQTSKSTISDAISFANKLGKIPILVKDSPGFLINRILLCEIIEAGYILEEGIDIETIDKILTDFGMPMGPFTLSDEVGLDVGFKVINILYEQLGERFKPPATFTKYQNKGWLGKKSGIGFYTYPRTKIPFINQKKKINPEIKLSKNEVALSEESIKNHQNRILFTMINEAARCLEDNIVSDPAIIDLGMIMGTGFPAFLGGLLSYADMISIDTIITELNNLYLKNKSERYKPCKYLLKLQEENKSFYNYCNIDKI